MLCPKCEKPLGKGGWTSHNGVQYDRWHCNEHGLVVLAWRPPDLKGPEAEEYHIFALEGVSMDGKMRISFPGAATLRVIWGEPEYLDVLPGTDIRMHIPPTVIRAEILVSRAEDGSIYTLRSSSVLPLDPWPLEYPDGSRARGFEGGVADYLGLDGVITENGEIGNGLEFKPRLGFEQARHLYVGV